MTPEREKLFWKHVPKMIGDDDGACQEWIGYRDNFGYGKTTIKCRVFLAHRVVWELAHGPIPAGLCVLHRCDNPACVRIDHLFLGTKKDNTNDMMAKGRQNFQKDPSKRPRGDRNGARTHSRKGENNNSVKLTTEQVMLIRASKGSVTARELAARYGVVASTIKAIFCRRNWSHLQ